MELLLKTYTDQPSRLGITYKYEYLARQAYEELIRRHRGDSFVLQVEPLKGKINVTLLSEQSGKKIPYPELYYKPDVLTRLESLSGLHMNLLFVHLYKEGNLLLVAKPFKKQEFFSITGCRIIGTGTFV
jgi:hypothetical protein